MLRLTRAFERSNQLLKLSTTLSIKSFSTSVHKNNDYITQLTSHTEPNTKDYYPKSEFVNNKYLNPWRDLTSDHTFYEFLRWKFIDCKLIENPLDQYPELQKCKVKSTPINIDKISSTSQSHFTWLVVIITHMPVILPDLAIPNSILYTMTLGWATQAF